MIKKKNGELTLFRVIEKVTVVDAFKFKFHEKIVEYEVISISEDHLKYMLYYI